MADTIYLDPDTWDWTADADGNIRVATGHYALAQDAASAIRLFINELYYDTSQGIPYFSQILGQMPPTSLMKAWFVRQALTVPGVVSAKAFITRWEGREVNGQVQITDALGNTAAASF